MATGKLIKQNPKERNEVWEFEDFFRKKWLYNNESWLSTHYKLLEQNCPTGYLKGWGSNENEMWLDTNRIKGAPATSFEYTPEFVAKIHNFCIEHYKKTKPYAHFDYELSNIIVQDDKITLVDWDNYGIYPEGQILDKIESDLKKGFGEKYNPLELEKPERNKDAMNTNTTATEKLKFVIELYSEYWKNPPIAEIYINEESKYKNYIKGTSENPDVIEFEHEFKEGDQWKLMIDRYNKSEKETNFKDGKILNDQLLHIKSINIDEIEIGPLVFKGVYTPKYPTRWAQQQKDAGVVLPETLENVTIMGHNGTWVFKAESPFYMWLLENLY
tara:strand:- start:4051 stop:5037 length:987 start_codon:yes stop_codon:yes gene_type:complete